MVLQGHLGGVLDLMDVIAEGLAGSGGGHGAGYAHLRLTAALSPGDGGIALGQLTEQARHAQSMGNVQVGQVPLILEIVQHRRQHAAGAAGGGGDDGAVVGVLLADSVGIGADLLALHQLRVLGLHDMLEHILGLALDVQAAGQLAGAGEALLHGTRHHMPHADEIVPNVGALIHLYVLHQIHIAVLAELQYLGKGVFHVSLLALIIFLPALDDDVAAADALYADAAQLLALPPSDEVQGVGMLQAPRVLLRENHLRLNGRKGVPQSPVGAVAPPRLGEGAVENGLKFIRLRMLVPKQHRRPGGTHGVRAGGAGTYFINISNGSHVLPLLV